MLNLWNTKRLADDVAGERLTSRTKEMYYVFSAVFYMVFAYLGSNGPPHYTWLHLYEGIVVCGVTFVGARRVVAAYSEPLDARFFETSFLVSIPLMIKATVVSWGGVYAAWWVLGWAMEQNVALDEPSRAVNYWGSRAYDLIPFILAVAVAVVFWLRLAHHVTYVVAKRG